MNITDFSPLYVTYAIVLLSSLGSADIAQTLNAINDKEAGDKTESPASVFNPFLQNITELVGNIRDTFQKWSQTNTPIRLNRQALSGCELIPTSIPNDATQYFACTREVNWFMAQRHCASHGMRLATVDTEVIFNELAPFVKNFIDQKGLNNTGFWIGGADLGSEGSWYWTSNGQFLKWSNWLAGEPNNKGSYGKAEDCLTILKKFGPIGFNDCMCDLKLPFICEVY